MDHPTWPQVFYDYYAFVRTTTRRLAGPQLDVTVWTRLHAARRDLLKQLKREGIESSSPLGEVP
jgi:hypothetical protein